MNIYNTLYQSISLPFPMDDIIEFPNNLYWDDLQPRGNPANFSFVDANQSQLDQCLGGNQQMIPTSSALIERTTHPVNKDSEQFVDCLIDLPNPAELWATTKEFKAIFACKFKQKKNTNITKFFVSSFEKEIKRLSKGGLIQTQHMKFLEDAKKYYASEGRRNIQMSALKILFGNKGLQMGRRNRRIFYNLLGSVNFKRYIGDNQFAEQHNKKQHLLASKVYRLRCFCGELTGRTQTQ